MTTVTLEGRLGHLVGKSFKFHVRTLREALAAIEANTGKLRSYLMLNSKRSFAIFINGKHIESDAELSVNIKDKNVLIIPVLFGGVVATSAAIAAAIFKTKLAIKIATFVISTILSAALSFGISLLVAKLMEQDDPKVVQTTSFVFRSAENTTKQGGPVPVGYGRMIIGSRVVSVNSFAVDKSEFDSDNLFTVSTPNNDSLVLDNQGLSTSQRSTTT